MTRGRGRERSHVAISAAVLAFGAPLILLPVAHRDAADPIDCNPYRGTEGPLEALPADGGRVTTGAAIEQIIAGSRFAWISTLCVPDGADVEMSMELARMDPPSRTIAWSDQHWPPGGLACLPEIGSMAVPRDAVSGSYELHRTVLVRLPRLLTRSLSLPPLHIFVEAPP